MSIKQWQINEIKLLLAKLDVSPIKCNRNMVISAIQNYIFAYGKSESEKTFGVFLSGNTFKSITIYKSFTIKI